VWGQGEWSAERRGEVGEPKQSSRQGGGGVNKNRQGRNKTAWGKKKESKSMPEYGQPRKGGPFSLLGVKGGKDQNLNISG